MGGKQNYSFTLMFCLWDHIFGTFEPEGDRSVTAAETHCKSEFFSEEILLVR